MSIQSLSFWQLDQNYYSQSQSFYAQDENYWNQQQAEGQASTADAALINVMSDAMTNLSKGLASIANQEALTRVNTELSADVQSALQSASSSSSTSSSSSSSTASSSSNASSGSSSGSSSGGTSSSDSSSSGSTGSSASTNASPLGTGYDPALALQTGSTAASILSADGVSGNLIDMLA